MRQGHGDRDVDADLSTVHVVLELSRHSAARREDGGAVAVRIGIDDLDGLLKSVCLQDHEGWTKDFLLVAVHACLHVRDDCGGHEISTRKSRYDGGPTVQHNGCSLLVRRLDQPLDACLGCRRDHWTDINSGIVPRANRQLLGLLSQVRNPGLRITHKDRGGERHAALSSCTEGSTTQVVQHCLLVRIGHHHTVVLGTHV
mmetsp:Transcript_60668/g.161212  ORF Transcript_60668/g.161212 Transcript_60668/m.161212 type:complete len:200 (-) Transcript_60668:852-1451(-)